MPVSALILHRLAAAAFLADLMALAIVGSVSRRRTRSLRVGRADPPADPPLDHEVRASRATFFAGMAGLCAVAYGLTVRHRIGWTSRGLIVAGGFVALTGLAGRVRIIRAGTDGLVICYAARPPLLMPWTECQGVRPPRSPLGGWQVLGADRSRTLMPSDLFGNEWLLASVIDLAGLSFDGRTWLRRPPGTVGCQISRTR